MPGLSGKANEVLEELRTVVLGRARLLDAILPPLAFLLGDRLAGPRPALLAALIFSLALVLWRWLRRQTAVYSLFGLLASALAFLGSQLLQRAEAFFLPDLITNLVLAALALGSLALPLPLVAWTSHLVRRWPRPWYAHPRVRPAYAEVTLAWSLYFLIQAGIQWLGFSARNPSLTACLALVGGWPATLVLLVLSYLYGTWRLRALAGPSVAELLAGTAPPWTGQKRGF